jgi:hypothetical protein
VASFHVGSGCFTLTAYEDALKQARKIFDMGLARGFDMRLLDIGGGFPGDDGGALTFQQIAQCIGPLLDQLFPKEVRALPHPPMHTHTHTQALAHMVAPAHRHIVSGAAGTGLTRTGTHTRRASHTHTHTHTYMYTRTHIHTHTVSLFLSLILSFALGRWRSWPSLGVTLRRRA